MRKAANQRVEYLPWNLITEIHLAPLQLRVLYDVLILMQFKFESCVKKKIQHFVIQRKCFN